MRGKSRTRVAGRGDETVPPGLSAVVSALPRLFRDSVIMETCEGPHSLLYTQALNDLVRFDVDPADFVHRATDHDSAALVDTLAAAMAAARRGENGTVAMADLAPRLLGGGLRR